MGQQTHGAFREWDLGKRGAEEPTVQVVFIHAPTARRATLDLPASATLSEQAAQIWTSLGLPSLAEGESPHFVLGGRPLLQDQPFRSIVPDGATVEVYSAHPGAGVDPFELACGQAIAAARDTTPHLEAGGDYRPGGPPDPAPGSGPAAPAGPKPPRGAPL